VELVIVTADNGAVLIRSRCFATVVKSTLRHQGAARFFDWLSFPARMVATAIAKARYHYNIMLRPEPDGGYTALVPALPGCVTYGRTVDEAREMAKDAISGHIASLRKHKDPIPTDDNTLVASLDLEHSR
jgi:antitoxin HicB